MDRYCRLTAADCTDRCCEGREIFYNRTDLLYLAVLSEPAKLNEPAGLGGTAGFTETAVAEDSKSPGSAADGRKPRIQVPPGQTRQKPNDPCRYLAVTGCTLARTVRPYVCVWYLCEAHVALLQEEPPGFQRRFLEVMQEIRTCRLKLEGLFDWDEN
jgi:hypothetical protein